jgi:uncharacterized protein (TIGR02246 family)
MRRTAFAIALLCMGSVWTAGVLQARPASAEDEVTAAEQAREDALTQNDFPALEKIMADDAVYCHSSGKVDSKASYIDTLKAGRNRYVKIDRYDAHVRVDGDMAVMNASLDLTVHPQGQDQHVEKVVATVVYEKRGGRWQMISSQSTRKPEPAAAPAAK